MKRKRKQILILEQLTSSCFHDVGSTVAPAAIGAVEKSVLFDFINHIVSVEVFIFEKYHANTCNSFGWFFINGFCETIDLRGDSEHIRWMTNPTFTPKTWLTCKHEKMFLWFFGCCFNALAQLCAEYLWISCEVLWCQDILI